MTKKSAILALTIFSTAFLTGCGPSGHYEQVKKTKIIKEVSIAPATEGNLSPQNTQVKVQMTPIFGKNEDMYPQLKTTTNWNYSYNHCYTTYSYYYKRNVRQCSDRSKAGSFNNLPLFQYPVFEVKVTNGTDHVLKFNNAVMAMEDSAGNMYDVLDKPAAKTYIKEVVKRYSKDYDSSIEVDRVLSNVDYADLYGSQSSLTIIDNNFKVLPGRTRTGFISFNIGKYTHAAQKEFIMKQQNLQVQLFEIPVDIDKAGKTIETSSYSFNYDVNVKEVEKDYMAKVWVPDVKK